MSRINMRLFFRWFAVMVMAVALLTALAYAMIPAVRPDRQTISSYGSRGAEVRAIQERLKERGLFHEDITGYYGDKTREAVLRFQKQQGISQTGTAGPVTLKALGISVGDIPPATESNIYLLARIISAEARGEPYVGQVAVGAVVLNRVEHPSFPDTLSGVRTAPSRRLWTVSSTSLSPTAPTMPPATPSTAGIPRTAASTTTTPPRPQTSSSGRAPSS